MKKLKYFLMGFKNVFTSDYNEIKKDYQIYDLWEKSLKIENKFRAINEKTRSSIKQHIYTAN